MSYRVIRVKVVCYKCLAPIREPSDKELHDVVDFGRAPHELCEKCSARPDGEKETVAR